MSAKGSAALGRSRPKPQPARDFAQACLAYRQPRNCAPEAVWASEVVPLRYQSPYKISILDTNYQYLPEKGQNGQKPADVFLKLMPRQAFCVFTTDQSFHTYCKRDCRSVEKNHKGLTMFETKAISAAKVDTSAPVANSQATKDSGRVRLGAGSIHFSDPTPAREATKDAGRVRMGAGSIQF